MSVIVQFSNSSDLTRICWKFQSFPIRKDSLETKVPKGFSTGVFNRLHATPSKSSNNGNLAPKSERIISLLLKVALKSTVVNSDS